MGLRNKIKILTIIEIVLYIVAVISTFLFLGSFLPISWMKSINNFVVDHIAICGTLYCSILVGTCIETYISNNKTLENNQAIEKDYCVKLMGVNFKNPDGIKIQEVIEYVGEGDTVSLHVDEYQGKVSVRADSHYGTIGYFPRNDANKTARIINQGVLGRVTVENICHSKNRSGKGIILLISVEDEKYSDTSIN